MLQLVPPSSSSSMWNTLSDVFRIFKKLCVGFFVFFCKRTQWRGPRWGGEGGVLELLTVKSRPGLRSRVRCFTHWAPQDPLQGLFWMEVLHLLSLAVIIKAHYLVTNGILELGKDGKHAIFGFLAWNLLTPRLNFACSLVFCLLPLHGNILLCL